MKTTKENDNRFTKDVLLRQIFEEISNENKENSKSTLINDLISTHEKASSKKSSFLKWLFIIIFVTSVSYLWFYTVTEVTQNNEVQTMSDSHTVPKSDQIEQQKEMIKLQDILKEESKNTHNIEETDSLQLTIVTPPKIEDQKSEREKAKEVLLIQMQNK